MHQFPLWGREFLSAFTDWNLFYTTPLHCSLPCFICVNIFRLTDIGLSQQTKTKLLVELLIPYIFSIIIVIQLHFFHKPLMMKINRILKYRRYKPDHDKNKTLNEHTSGIGLSDIQHSTSTMATGTASMSDDSGDSNEEFNTSTLSKMKNCYRNTTMILWRFAEIHAPKIVCFVVMLVVVQQVRKYLFLVQWTLSLEHPLSRTSLNFEQFSRSLPIDSSLIFSLYLELSLSRANSLVSCEFEIERVHCTCSYKHSLV